MKRYKAEDIDKAVAPYDPNAGEARGKYDGQTPYFYTIDGKYHTEPAPRSGLNYWLDEEGNPLPAIDKRDVVFVHDDWKEDAAKTLNRLLSRKEESDYVKEWEKKHGKL